LRREYRADDRDFDRLAMAGSATTLGQMRWHGTVILVPTQSLDIFPTIVARWFFAS
jgi:hypothetical protein